MEPFQQVRELIAAGQINEAVLLVRGEEDVELLYRLHEILSTSTDALHFLDEYELRSARVAAATAWLLRETRKLGRFYPEGFCWPHRMSLHAAAFNVTAAYQCQRNHRSMLENGFIGRVKVACSANGPCPVCAVLAGREFALADAPVPPFRGCTNYEDGCRCALIITRLAKT